MMRLSMSKPRPEGGPREVAVHWLSREVEGRLSPEDAEGLRDWLAADPSHSEVYERARSAVEAPRFHSAHPDMMALRQEALAALKESPAPRWRYAAAAAGVMGAVVLGAGWVGLRPNTEPSVSRIEAVARSALPALNPNAAIYSTKVGERVSVTLPDGSVATLNTDTVLKIAYTGAERGVRLVQGQALFEVAKHKPAPFRVYAGDRRITALGTTFDVRLDRGKVKVALIEGIVRVAAPSTVSAAEAPLQQVVMTAGEILEATPASTMTVRPGDAANAAVWRAGVVSFRATPLAEAVAEVNRYTENPLTIADPSIAGYRITGVFRTGDPGRFANSVAEVLPVSVENSPDGSKTLVRDEKKGASEG